MAYGATTTLQSIENAQWRIFRAFFYEEPMDSLQESTAKHQLQTQYELFLSQILSELLRQNRRNIPIFFSERSLYPKKSVPKGERKILYLISTTDKNLGKDHKKTALRYIIVCVAQI